MAIAAYLAFEPDDADAARAIAAELEQHGWSAILAGPDYRIPDKLGALVQAVGQAGVVVVLASAAAQELLIDPAAAAVGVGHLEPAALLVRHRDLRPAFEREELAV